MKKILREKLIIFLAHIIARPLLLAYRGTLSIKLYNRKYIKECRERGEKIIYTFWHENMIIPLLVHEKQGIHVLVSRHFDGDVIATILKTFGYLSIRGSSTRGGRKAYQDMKSKMNSDWFEIAFTPDGPTGPRRQAKAGLVRLASETGSPIIQLAVAANRILRLNSWDRLLLILPFSRCILIYKEPLYIPAKLTANELHYFTKKLTEETNQLEEEATKWLSP